LRLAGTDSSEVAQNMEGDTAVTQQVNEQTSSVVDKLLAEEEEEPTTSNTTAPVEEKETVSFTVTFNKIKYPIEWPIDDTVTNLKTHIARLTGVPVPLQKLMYTKG
jgi:hypothetical protein